MLDGNSVSKIADCAITRNDSFLFVSYVNDNHYINKYDIQHLDNVQYVGSTGVDSVSHGHGLLLSENEDWLYVASGGGYRFLGSNTISVVNTVTLEVSVFIANEARNGPPAHQPELPGGWQPSLLVPETLIWSPDYK